MRVRLADTLAAAWAVEPEYRLAAWALFERIDAMIGEWTSDPDEKTRMAVEVAIQLTMRRWHCSRENAAKILAAVVRDD